MEYKEEDSVRFVVNGETFDYIIKINHLACKYGNSIIFSKLKLSKESFCKEVYGYRPRGGSWPSYRIGDMKAANRVIIAIRKECERVSNSNTVKTTVNKYLGFVAENSIRQGDYVMTTHIGYTSYGQVEKIDSIHGSGTRVKLARRSSSSSSNRHWDMDRTRLATEKEILASRYANRYKSNLKTGKNEVQSKIKAVNSRHREEPIRPRRSAVKVTSSSGLTGNKISIRSRRGKVRTTQIKQTVFTISRS